MNSSIKFCGKRVDNGEWVFGSLVESKHDKHIVGTVVEFNEDYFNTEFWWTVHPETVGQFTGRTDDGEDELYDGDIIKFDYELRTYEGVIKWLDSASAFIVKANNLVPLFLYDIDDAVTKIGNIYENDA